MPYCDSFEIDMIAALADQLVMSFDKLEIGPLTEKTINTLSKGQGVYMLFHKKELVYVGKSKDLQKRLREHCEKISGRLNINVKEMGFKCLYVHKNWTALAPENSLINHYKRLATNDCSWNGNGFGPHDPGREREKTNKAPDGFDALYPIKAVWVCDWIEAKEWNIKELLESLKSGLPYLLRYQTSNSKSWKAGHPDYNSKKITVPANNMFACDLLRLIVKELPGWQATEFPSHMILYKETENYKHGKKL